LKPLLIATPNPFQELRGGLVLELEKVTVLTKRHEKRIGGEEKAFL